LHLILPVFVAFAEKKSGGSVTRLARVDAQREKLSGQLSKLEATECVLVLRGAAEGTHLREGNGIEEGSRRSVHGDGVPIPHPNPMSCVKAAAAPPPARKEVLGTAQRVIPDRMEPT